MKPGLLQCMGSQRFKHDLAIEHKQQIWIQPNYSKGESILKIKEEIHQGLLSRGVGLSFLLLYNIPLIFSLCVNKGYLPFYAMDALGSLKINLWKKPLKMLSMYKINYMRLKRKSNILKHIQNINQKFYFLL